MGISKSRRMTLVLLLALVLVDSYADDLLQIFWPSFVNLVDPPRFIALSYTYTWILVSILSAVALFYGFRLIQPRESLSRAVAWCLLLTTLVLICLNQIVRMDVVVIQGATSMTDIPEFYFIMSYAERLFVFALVAAVAILCAIWLARLFYRIKVSIERRFLILFAIAVLVMASLINANLCLAGVRVLRNCEFWEGESIRDGSVWMGSTPRGILKSIDIPLTLAFLALVLCLSVSAGRLMKPLRSLEGVTGDLIIVSAILALPAVAYLPFLSILDLGAKMNLYYIFHHDRMISSVTLPAMIYMWTRLLWEMIGRSNVQNGTETPRTIL